MTKPPISSIKQLSTFRPKALLILWLLTICSSNLLAVTDIRTTENFSNLKELFKQCDSLFLQNRYAKADSLTNKLLLEFQLNNFTDSLLYAETYHLKGRIYNNMQLYDEGISMFKKSLSLKLKNHRDEFRTISKTYNTIGVSFFFLENFDSANYYYQRAINPLVNNNIWEIDLYYSYINMGINYASIGKYNESLLYFDTAFQVINKGDLINDSLTVSNYYQNYGLYKTITGKLHEANEYFNKAEAIYLELYGENSLNGAVINFNKGINLYLGFYLDKAELYLKKGLDIFSKIDNGNNSYVNKAYLNLNLISQQRREYPLAIEYCQLGLNNNPSNNLKLQFYENIAESYKRINNYDKASEYYDQALKALDLENINKTRKFNVYTNYAEFLLLTGRPSESINYLNKALSSVKTIIGQNSQEYADVMLIMGDYYLSQFEYDNAIEYYRSAKVKFDSLANENEGDNLNNINAQSANIGIGNAFLKKYENNNNLEYLFKADNVFNDALLDIKSIKNQLSTENKLLLNGITIPVYKKATYTSMLIYNETDDYKYLDAAFNFMEQGKSSALLADIVTEHALKTSDIPDNVFDFEHQLKEDITVLQQLLKRELTDEEPDTTKVLFFENELLKYHKIYDSLIVQIETNYPRYYSAKYNTDAIKIEEVSNNLDDDEVLLEYMIDDSILYVISISNKKSSLASIAIDSNFYNSLDHIISLKHVDLAQQNLNEFNKFKYHAHELWKILIEPQIEFIANNRLIIIPDGILNYLPFDLLTEYDFVAEKISYRKLPYLIKNNPISYSYSATLRYNKYFADQTNKKNNGIIAFAPKYEDEPINQLNNLVLDDLSFAKNEAISLVNEYGGQVFIDDDATKKSFEDVSSKSNILHLAMHAAINDSLPLQSKLVFYDNPNDSSSYMLNTYELYNMDISASLVTLSACNTGSGSLSNGEGIMSMARGFIYSGVPTIVMTLWDIQDKTGSKIMDKYYQNLSQGIKKDVALQKAKLSVLSEANMATAHPYFWAAYVVTGDTKPIEVSSSGNKKLAVYILISVLVLLSIVFFKSWRTIRY